MDIKGKVPLYCIMTYHIGMVGAAILVISGGVLIFLYGESDSAMETWFKYGLVALFGGFSILVVRGVWSSLAGVVRYFEYTDGKLLYRKFWHTQNQVAPIEDLDYLARRRGTYGGGISIGIIFKDGKSIELLGGTKDQTLLIKQLENLVPYND